MTQTFDAIYENGVFRPLVGLPSLFTEGQHVQLLVIHPEAAEEERESWMRFSLKSLASAYGDDEPEYGLDSLREVNPDYRGP